MKNRSKTEQKAKHPYTRVKLNENAYAQKQASIGVNFIQNTGFLRGKESIKFNEQSQISFFANKSSSSLAI